MYLLRLQRGFSILLLKLFSPQQAQKSKFFFVEIMNSSHITTAIYTYTSVYIITFIKRNGTFKNSAERNYSVRNKEGWRRRGK